MKTSFQDKKDQLLQQISISLIRVFVTFPNYSTKKFKVNQFKPISKLFQFYPEGKKTVFFNGRILQDSKNFYSFGIGDLDRIAIVPSEQLSFSCETFWRKATQRDDETKENLYSVNDPKIKHQYSRLQDIKLQKIENSSKAMRMLLTKYQYLFDSSIENNTTTNFPSFQQDSPSETSLPVLW